MSNNIANKIIPVADGVAGTPIELHDYRISSSTSPSDGEVLAYSSRDGKYINTSISDANTVAMVYCDTPAGTQAKTASCTGFTLKNPSYMMVTIKTTSTYSGKTTLNINNTGAKDMYLDGAVTSSSNKISAGTYWVYYKDNKYYFRNDGKLTVNGNAFGGSYNDLTETPSIPDCTSDLTNDSGYITGVSFNGTTAPVSNDIAAITATIPTATSDLTNDSGFITSSDIPSIPDSTSDLTNDSGFVTSSDLASVATSGNYNDLSNTPTIPAAQVQTDWDATTGMGVLLHKPTIPCNIEDLDNVDVYDPSDYQALAYSEVHNCWENTSLSTVAYTGNYDSLSNKPGLSTVATSGSYNDLSNKPSIPSDLDDLGDVTITSNSLTNDQVLMYDTNTWVNKSLAVVATSGAYSSLSGTPDSLSDFTDDLGYDAVHTHRQLWDNYDIVPLLDEDSDYTSYNNYISTSTGKWTTASGYKHWAINIEGIRKVTVVANNSNSSYVSFLKTHDSYTSGTTADFATGYTSSYAVQVSTGNTKSFIVPSDAKYLYLNTGNNNAAKAAHVYLTGTGITEHTGDGTGFIKDDGSVDTTSYQEELPSLSGNANKVLAVTSGEDDLEWVSQSGGTTLPSYTGNAGKVLAVNNAADGVEWVAESGGYSLDAGTDLEIIQSYVPDGYTEQTSVYNSSSTRLNTGIRATVDDIVMEIKVKPSTGAWYIFQSRSTSSTNATNGIGGASSGARIQASFCDSGIVRSDITRTTSHWYTVRMTVKSGNLTLYVKDETAGTSDTKTGTYTYTESTLPMYIWGNNQGNTIPANNYIEYAWMKVGGKKVMHYIPAKRNSDNKAGFWDLVTQTFKTTTSGTANAAGDATSHNVINFTNDTGYAVLPSYSSEDAGKMLSVNSSGTGYEWNAVLPSYSSGDANKVLSVNSSGNALEWDTVGSGGTIVQSDWEQTDTTADDYIKHKPTIPSVPGDFGITYGTCTDDPESNPNEALSVTLPNDYQLKDGGLIAVRFTNSIPAESTLSFANETFSISYRGVNLADDVIQSGDTVLMQTREIGRDNWSCCIVTVDRWSSISGLNDTEISSLDSYQTLIYYNGKWRNNQYPTVNGGLIIPNETSPYDTIIPLHTYVNAFFNANNVSLTGVIGKPIFQIVFSVFSSSVVSQILFQVTNDYRLHFNKDADFELNSSKPYKLITCTRIHDGSGHLSFAVDIEDLTVANHLGASEHNAHLIAAT